jgi:hypothetical protein
MYWPIWQYKAMPPPWANGSSSYLPYAKPPEPGNWMLDLLLAGQGFTAERASFDIQEAGLTLEFKELAKANVEFFSSASSPGALCSTLQGQRGSAAIDTQLGTAGHTPFRCARLRMVAVQGSRMRGMFATECGLTWARPMNPPSRRPRPMP